MRTTLTPELCFAAALDLAKANMRREGRTACNDADDVIFAKEYNRLYAIYDGGETQRMANEWEAQHMSQDTGY